MSGVPILSAFDLRKRQHWPKLFFKFSTEKFERFLRIKGESFWQKAGERRALRLFHEAADRVPAYKDFLRKHRVRAKTIKTIRDFSGVPITTKENYIDRYSLMARCWDGDLARAGLIAVSSGTTGEPKYWPRGGFQEFESSVVHELLYRSFFEIDRQKTLLLIGFPMGVYVSGMATLMPSWLVSHKVKNLSAMSVGNNKAEMLRALKHLSGAYEQVVLAGHPFFIKDVIETGKKEGIPWKKFRVRMMFCSEGFSELWRDYVVRVAGGDPRDLRSALATYGSSELLLIGYETPLSVALRKTLYRNNNLLEELTGLGPVPSIFQYNPLLRFIEVVNRELIFTAASGIPLIRFNLKDSGDIIGFREAVAAVKSGDREAFRFPGTQSSWWQLPFVTLRGRSDRTIIFYAANIYPEHIHAGLHHPKLFKKLTGKFTMRKDYTKNMDEFLEINIELRPDLKPHPMILANVRKEITTHLQKINMEYSFLWSNLDKDIRPRIKLWPYQHKKYFKPGLKPRYII